MNRRDFTLVAAAATSALAAPPKSKMGICTTSYMTFRRFRDTHAFLEHCASLGAAGIQAPPPADPPRFRRRLEELGMWFEGMVALPKGDTSMYEAQLKACQDGGAAVVRSGCLGGRRYETFSSMESWKKFVAESKESLRKAVPLLDKYKLTMALENHKDWTLEEHIALLREFSHPRLGALVDFGNNVALLDEPHELVEQLAPYAASTHVKDMAYEEDPAGFRMSEVPLGDGRLDLRRMLGAIRRNRPQTRFVLEMITRDPLLIPCLTEKYWETYSDRTPRHLSRTLAMVRREKSREALPRFTELNAVARFNADAQVKAEENNVKTCLHFGREQLGL
jgi:sugar phosphate isomerase/epimerase